jgi:hypothetical protein
MNPTNMNMTEQTQPNVMAENAMIPPPATQATTATDQAAINVDLQKRLDFLDLNAVEMDPVHQDDEVAPFIKDAEETRKAKAEKRLHAKLRKLEVEQKAILLAEAQKSLKEARRMFESEPQLPYDYTPRPPSSINDLFRAEKARDELIALEREQKEALYNEEMEKRAREFGDDWPRIQQMSHDPRFDHIPKRWPEYRGLIPNYFHDHPLIPPQESNEHPATS